MSRVKNWGNTMEALRIKREEDRIKRLEDEEVSDHPAANPSLTAAISTKR